MHLHSESPYKDKFQGETDLEFVFSGYLSCLYILIGIAGLWRYGRNKMDYNVRPGF